MNWASLFKKKGTLFAGKKHSDGKYSDKWASLSLLPFQGRKGNCIFNSLEESWRKYTWIAKYLKRDIVHESTCIARKVVSETPQGTFPKFHRNSDIFSQGKQDNIKLRMNRCRLLSLYYELVMTLYILFSLPQFSFSIEATFQHFIKCLDSVALKSVEIQKKGKFQRLPQKKLQSTLKEIK